MRKIIHLDMDCFFAAVERKHNTKLLGLPIAVGGKAESRGVIATASYEARKFGVRSAMATAKAVKLCPDLILLYPQMNLYKEESLEIFKIFKRYTDIIQPLSLDEAFLDVTDSPLHDGSATLLAKEIRETVLIERGLTCSAGIASNKFLAKVCSDLKKPYGQYTVHPDRNFDFASKLPVKKIFGVGAKTAEKMKNMNIHLCSDLQKLSLLELQKNFGSLGTSLHKTCRGVDDRPVKTDHKRKSYSAERTFNQDLKEKAEIVHYANEVYQLFCKRFKKSEISESKIKTVLIKLKNENFKVRSRDIKAPQKLPSSEFAVNEICNFWLEQPDKIRLIGFGVRLQEESDQPQLEFSF